MASKTVTKPRKSDAEKIADAVEAAGDSIRNGLRQLGTGNAATEMGALEAHAVITKEGAEMIAEALYAVSAAIVQLAEAVQERRDG